MEVRAALVANAQALETGGTTQEEPLDHPPRLAHTGAASDTTLTVRGLMPRLKSRRRYPSKP